MSGVKQRVRSPNYPALGLASALQQTQKLFAKIQTYPASKDLVITGLGYGSYNGASAGALSAQLKYGLVEKVGSDYKLTDRALAILHPRDPAEKVEALRAAAKAPSLFAELLDHFRGKVPNDDLLRSYLIRKGFAQSAITPVIQAFRETVELVPSDATAYDRAASAGPNTTLQEPHAKVGDYVQWTSQGMDQFRIPREVVWVSEDGNWVRVQGSPTGIPMSEVQIVERPKSSISNDASMTDLDTSTMQSAGRHNILKVLINGDRLQVSATIFDRKGLEKLIKTLNANKELLDDEKGSGNSESWPD